MDVVFLGKALNQFLPMLIHAALKIVRDPYVQNAMIPICKDIDKITICIHFSLRFFDSAADGGFAQNDRCLGFSFYPKDSSPPPRNDTVSVILVTAATVILSGVSAANAAEGSYHVHRKRFFDSLRSLRMTLFLSS